jgi:rhombotarget A family protien
MLKRIIGLSLLCIAGNAYSTNIVVNTTEDEFDKTSANGSCSLREAVELVNSTGTDGKIPAAGFGGCTGDTPVIVLESGKTYNVTDKFATTSDPDRKQISIKRSVAINSLPSGSAQLKFDGEKNSVIQYVGKTPSRLFAIQKSSSTSPNITVSFNQVDFIGCNKNAAESTTKPQINCDNNGGIIYNQETLIIAYSRMTNGAAINGGAIFNEGVASNGSTEASAGVLALNNLYFSHNRSQEGVAIYSVHPRYEITNSVFRDNTATSNTGTVVHVNRALILTEATGTSLRTGNIRNSVFFKNTARVANLQDGMVINNSTIIGNAGGVILNSINGAANFSNSIVAKNGGQDCIGVPENTAKTNNLLYEEGACGDGEKGNPNTPLSDLPINTLIAGDSLEGVCAKPPAKGLLCPFRTENEVFNGYFKPRLLVDYKILSESPIVNRGRVNNDGTTTNSLACESQDQRGKARETIVLCDIGSVELTIEDKGKIGKDIKFGETAEIDLTDFLGDGELWPKANCDDVYGALPAGQVWQEGCMRFVAGKEAKKGELAIDSAALLKYKALRNFHGSDNFSVDIVTTTSRFSQAVNNRSITLRGTIVQEPADNFDNKSVNLSGGSVGLFSLLGILGLASMRRRLQGV